MEFLSEEWVAALDSQLRKSDVRLEVAVDTVADSDVLADTAGIPESICVQNIAEREAGDPPLCYFIQIDNEGATATFGQAPEHTVVFTQPYEVAVSVAQRRRDAHAAFLLGEIKVSGDVTALLPLGDITAQIQEIVATLATETEFPQPV